MAVNDDLLDRAIRHAILIERLTVGEILRQVGFLNREVFPSIVDVTLRGTDQLVSRGLKGMRTERFRSMVRRIAEISQVGYRQFHQRLAAVLDDLSKSEGAWQARAIRVELPGAVPDGLIVPPTGDELRAIRRSLPFRGRVLREWAAKLDVDTRAAAMGAIREGMMARESASEIVRRLRGTRAASFRDGILKKARADAAMVVRTSMNHVAARAHEAVYRANSDLITAVQWVSVIDARTSVTCNALDGQSWPVDRGPRPPAHPNCRSTTVPVMAGFEEFGLRNPDEATRATLDGEVPASKTAEDVLRSMSRARQDLILGKGRADVFRRGVVPFEKFITRQLKPLTVRELEALELRLEAA